MGDEVFLTAFVAVDRHRRRAIRYANAGHPPAYVCTGVRRDRARPDRPVGRPAGAGVGDRRGHDRPPATTSVRTPTGSSRVRNVDKEFFGAQRLVDLLQGSRCDEAPAVVKRCIDEVELFSPGGLSR